MKNLSTLVPVLLAAIPLLAGCGNNQADGRDDALPAVVVPARSASVATGEKKSERGSAAATSESSAQVAMLETSGGPEIPEPASMQAGSPDSLPPDVIVTVDDTVVAPGAPIDFVAQGTPDVKQVILRDGMGDMQAFHYDHEAKAWRLTYRVPLKPRSERFGVSVTARNEADRWRRVWVFLTVEQQKPVELTASPDSGGSTADDS